MEEFVDMDLLNLIEEDSVSEYDGEISTSTTSTNIVTSVSSNDALLHLQMVTNYLLGCVVMICLFRLGWSVCQFFYRIILDDIFKHIF